MIKQAHMLEHMKEIQTVVVASSSVKPLSQMVRMVRMDKMA